MFLVADKTCQKRAERKNGRKEGYKQDSVDRSHLLLISKENRSKTVFAENFPELMWHQSTD